MSGCASPPPSTASRLGLARCWPLTGVRAPIARFRASAPPPPRSSAAAMADDDDVAMREADAGLGADDERDGARAGALARPSRPGCAASRRTILHARARPPLRVRIVTARACGRAIALQARRKTTSRVGPSRRRRRGSRRTPCSRPSATRRSRRSSAECAGALLRAPTADPRARVARRECR